MSNTIKKYTKDLTQSPDMDPMEYARREGLLPPAEAPKMQIPEAAQLAQPPAANGAPTLETGIKAPAGGNANEFKKPGGGVAEGAAKGALDIVQNMYNAGVEVLDSVENFAASKGIGSGDVITESSRMNLPYLSKNPKAGPAEEITRGIVKYGAPVAALTLSGVGPLAATAAGAGIDFTTIDPKEERLSSIILNEAPSLKNVAVLGSTLDYLAKPSPGLEGRFKNVLEGLGVGGAVAGMMRGAQKLAFGARAYQEAKAAARAIPVAGAEAAPALEGAAREARIKEIANPYKEPAAIETKMVDGKAVPIEQPTQVKGQTEVPPVEPVAPAKEPQQLELKAFDDSHIIKSASDEAMANLSSGDFLAFAGEYAKAHPERDLEKAPRNWTELRQDTKNMLNDPQKVEKLMQWKMTDRPLDPVEVDASRYLMENMSSSLVDSAEKALASGDDAAFALFSQHLDGFRFVDDIKTGAGSVAGEAFNAHKLTQSVTGMKLSEYNKLLTDAGRVKLVQDVLQKSGGKQNLEEIAKQIAAIKNFDPSKVDKMVSKAYQSSGGSFEKFRESTLFYMRNAMLSSPKTAVANFVSNAFTTANSVATKYTAGVIGMDRAMLRDANAYTSGIMSSFMEHLVTVKNALVTLDKSKVEAGAVGKEMIKFEMARPNPISATNWGLAPEGMLGKMVDISGEVIAVPSKLSSAPDAFFGSMMYRGELTQRANRAAQDLVDAGRLKPEGVGDFVQKFIADPPVDVHNHALEFSKTNTFAQALEPGSFTQSMNTTISKFAGGWGEGIFPFFKTTANIVDYTFQHSPFKPLAAAVSPNIRNELMQGGEIGATAWAKIANGSMMLGAFTYLASQGLVTGPEPKNFMVKKALDESGNGWQPTSVLIGGKYVSLARIEPLNSYMRLGAIMSQAKNYTSQDEYEQYAVIAGSAMADFFTPEQLVENSGELFSAMAEASSYGGVTPKIKAVMADMASRFVPAVAGNVRGYTDPFAASTMEDKNKGFAGAVDKIENALMNKIPWLSNDLPAQRNIFGEPILVPDFLGPDMISPFATSKKDASPLTETMLKLAKYNEEMGPTNKNLIPMAVTMPSKTFEQNGVTLELTPQEYDRLVMYSAGYNPDTEKPMMPPLRQVLERTVVPLAKSMEGREMSPAVYNQIVGAMSGPLAQYRAAGKQLMLTDKNFRNRWLKAVEANTQQGLKGP